MTPPRKVRVLVCGGRELDRAAVWNWLESFAKTDIGERLGCGAFDIACVIHGDAAGADQGAAQWGASEHAQVLSFPADWKQHGRSAGPIRNAKMLRHGKPDVVVAFEGGRGTANMCALAEAAGVPIVRARALPQTRERR